MARVFITGIGIVSPLGHSKEALWSALMEGRSGIGRLEKLDTSQLPVLIGGEVRDLDPTQADVNDKVTHRRMDPASLYAVIGARKALVDAGLPTADLGPRAAVVLGAGLAGLVTLEEQTANMMAKGPRSVSVFTIPLLMPNAPPSNISMAFGVRGSCYNLASACSSSGHAMIDAFEMLQRDEADLVITGGTENAITRLSIASFANMRAMTKKFNDDPTRASRPFDKDRDGFVISEGSAILIFESESHLRSRGGRAYAEVIGHGATMDAYHLVQPDSSGVGAADAISRSINRAGLKPEDIAGDVYINAHGTSTHYNDLMETNALKLVFGAAASKLRISSTKSMLGHLIGAAAAIEMATCCMALQEGYLPPTINYTTPDPECDLDYIPNEPRQARVRYALNPTFGFGGHNVSLLIQAV